MHATVPSALNRHAFKVALIYLLIRGLPILFMSALPRDMFAEMAQSGHWLHFRLARRRITTSQANVAPTTWRACWLHGYTPSVSTQP